MVLPEAITARVRGVVIRPDRDSSREAHGEVGQSGGLVVGIADLQEHHTGDHNAGGSTPGNDGTLKGIVAFVDDVPQLEDEDVGEYKTDSAHYQDGHSILHNGPQRAGWQWRQ